MRNNILKKGSGRYAALGLNSVSGSVFNLNSDCFQHMRKALRAGWLL